jgi:hypothetical protein
LKKLFLNYFSIILLFIACTPKMLVAQELFTLGPMVHFNIGDKFRPAYGLEFSYWNYEHFPYSIDVGMEFEKSKFRIYSEAQTGIALTGVSAGPFIEFEKQAPVQVGLQGTVWANYILGLDFRFRIMSGKNYFGPGIYAKYLWMKGGTNNNSSSGGSHHHFDWD